MHACACGVRAAAPSASLRTRPPPRPRSDTGDHPLPEHNAGKPGACTFGPDLSWVGVTFRSSKEDGELLCPDWFHQPGAVQPANLYLAQLARRRKLLSIQQAAATAAVDAEAAAVRAAALAPPPATAEMLLAAGGDPAAAAEAAAGMAGAAVHEAPAHTAEQAAVLAALEAEEE